MAAQSRWWWWVAGLPAGVAFWAVTVLWLALATGGTGLLADPFGSAVQLSTAVLAVPLLVLAVLFPVAVYRDASALVAGGLLDRDPRRLGTAAAASLLTGPVLSVPLACWYLWRRHAVAGVP